MAGATVGLACASTIAIAVLLPEMFVGKNILLRILLGIGGAFAAIAISFGIAKLFRSLPLPLGSALLGSGLVITWCVYAVLSAYAMLPLGTSWQLTLGVSFIIAASVMMISVLLGTAIAAYPKASFLVVLVITLFVAGLYWFAEPNIKKDVAGQIHILRTAGPVLDAPYPAAMGTYKIKTLFYGGGTDKHRPEFGAHADLITAPVDASPFVPRQWSVARTSYWGFDQTRLPINGRVWLPEGKGDFPLVLIVHGASHTTDFSDTGFSYLGELLASRGYIVVSVDENFLNYGWQRYGDFEDSDIDARGWLLLQHLRLWQEWNKNKQNPFFEKVDMGRIALIGHSRGGEAIAAAAAFNRMGRYPKNGNIVFDLKFNIRTLIALAPGDIYQPPYERTTPAAVRDVNYLLLLGTYDRQVPCITGSRVYQRVSFSRNASAECDASGDEPRHAEFYMKSALYIYRANHSQFNSVWGRYDFPWPYRLFSNVSSQLSGDEQRRIAQIYVSAFLDATLKGNKSYLPLFRDHRLIDHWLPRTSYISRFQDSSFHVIANFDEDIDPETATVKGGTILGRNLSSWREEDIDYYYYLPYGSRSNRVASIRWEAQDSTPVFGIRLPEKQVRNWKLGREDMLVFSIACPDAKETPDISIELMDKAGRTSRLHLNGVLALEPPLQSYLTRMRFLEHPTPLIVLQTVSVPLSRFLAVNAALDLGSLRQVNFLFDKRSPGKVLLDDIGFDQKV